MELLPSRSDALVGISPLTYSHLLGSSVQGERSNSNRLRHAGEREPAARQSNPWFNECRNASHDRWNLSVSPYQRNRLDASLNLTSAQVSTGEERTRAENSDDGSSPSTSKGHDTPSSGTVVPHAYHSMLAGAAAGLTSSVVTCPLDVVKTRLQAQVSKKGAADYEGVKETITKIWRSAGVRGLYRGLGPTVLGYLPTWGIYFSVYDQIKNSLTPEGEFSSCASRIN
jgi:hypothetical protein